MKQWLSQQWFSKQWLAKRLFTPIVDISRRRLLGGLLAGGGLAAMSTRQAIGSEEKGDTEKLRFPGDTPDHRLVYQFNTADEDTQQAILFSVGAMLRKWGDNIGIVVVAIGPGIHILAKHPLRAVPKEIRERVSSLNEYGVKFHACGNTMKSLKWEEKDMLAFAKIVEVGASDLMELQEEGYSYIKW
jgi:intracellular sulfur oxidation DsrE/DsrF family protein